MTTPLPPSATCQHCGDELRYDPWMLAWVDRHHALRVTRMRTSGLPHTHSPRQDNS